MLGYHNRPLADELIFGVIATHRELGEREHNSTCISQSHTKFLTTLACLVIGGITYGPRNDGFQIAVWFIRTIERHILGQCEWKICRPLVVLHNAGRFIHRIIEVFVFETEVVSSPCVDPIITILRWRIWVSFNNDMVALSNAYEYRLGSVTIDRDKVGTDNI